jgi:DNA-binding transcriptional MocR family regulator
VRSGRIPPETLLPPVRQVATRLGVSPGTAAAAYRLLRQRGIVRSDGRRGTHVLPLPAQREYADPDAPRGALDLRSASPDPALLPDLARVFSALDPRPGDYDDTHLDPELARRMREGFEADGVPGGELLATSGAVGAIHRALRATLSPGDRVAVEDPGFNEHHACVSGLALSAVPVEVDDEGMRPEPLRAALRAGAKAVVLTARCQSPTGAAFSAGRAAALREILAAHPAVAVLVDDYASLLADAPYHDCLGRGRQRWLVVRSFNKPVAPDLRVAVAAGDAVTLERMRREQWLTDGWVSGFLQRVALATLVDRRARAAITRAGKTYAERRTALLAALRERGIAARGRSGLVVWVPVHDEAEVVAGLAARSVCVRAGARYRLQSPPAVRIATATLPAERAERLADDLAAVLRPGTRARTP